MVIYVDIETTGLDPKAHTLTRFTGIKANGYEVIDIIDQWINPKRLVDPKLLEMTGAKQSILDLMPVISEVKPEINEFLRGHKLVSWGDFESRWFSVHGFWNPPVINLINLTKPLLKPRLNLENMKLNTVCKALGITLRHHNSLSDAFGVYHIANLTRVLR